MLRPKHFEKQYVSLFKTNNFDNANYIFQLFCNVMYTSMSMQL